MKFFQIPDNGQLGENWRHHILQSFCISLQFTW